MAKVILVTGLPSCDKLNYCKTMNQNLSNSILINPIEIVKSLYGHYDFDLENSQFFNKIVNNIILQAISDNFIVIYYANKELDFHFKNTVVHKKFEDISLKTVIQKDQQNNCNVGKINLEKIYNYAKKLYKK